MNISLKVSTMWRHLRPSEHLLIVAAEEGFKPRSNLFLTLAPGYAARNSADRQSAED